MSTEGVDTGVGSVEISCRTRRGVVVIVLRRVVDVCEARGDVGLVGFGVETQTATRRRDAESTKRPRGDARARSRQRPSRRKRGAVHDCRSLRFIQRLIGAI